MNERRNKFYMTKKKRITLIAILIIIFLLIGCYTIYGFTLINPNSTESIIRHLTVDKDNPPKILATDSLDNYVCVIYFDKAFDNISYARVVLEKNKLYPNRYNVVSKGHSSNWGEDYGLFLQNTPHNTKIKGTNKEKAYFYVYGFTSQEIPYDVIYTDEYENQKVIYSSKAYADNGSYVKIFSIEIESENSKNYDLPNIELIS